MRRFHVALLMAVAFSCGYMLCSLGKCEVPRQEDKGSKPFEAEKIVGQISTEVDFLLRERLRQNTYSDAEKIATLVTARLPVTPSDPERIAELVTTRLKDQGHLPITPDPERFAELVVTRLQDLTHNPGSELALASGGSDSGTVSAGSSSDIDTDSILNDGGATTTLALPTRATLESKGHRGGSTKNFTSEREEARARQEMPYRDESGVQHLPKESTWSEYGQDLWVAQNHPEPGFYLDIGAHHGHFLSNTNTLDRLGWKGLCVEPLILENRDWKRRSCDIIAAAVLPVKSPTGTVSFTDCERGAGVSGHSGVYAMIDRSTIERRACPEVKVKAVTILDLLPKLPPVVDYMSMDVEGAELGILRTMPWNKVCISRMTIESKGATHPAIANVVKTLIPHKCRVVYRRAQTEDFVECNCEKFTRSA
eukprot:TRINITY_DN109168_c0_g1_i1.p1 TRINITY_DN109168_c0_g1~~TRINITY_DN109168_c0_g1_i1.p1  ORF type:complete len:443 (-),score=52.82 TRINITY_DN109168_c0_g1_i1:113-1384(-)